jgi:hypothetical protein
MKKLLPLFVLLLISSQAISQVKISLRVSPALVNNRVTDTDNNDGVNVGNNGSQFAFVAGPTVDFFMSDNFAFSTGLSYQSTRIGGKLNNYSFNRSLQYIQAPVTFKAFTNELSTNLNLYFQLGGTLNVKINEKLKSSNYQGFLTNADPDADIKIVSPVDVGLYVGAGINYKIAENNSVFAGMYYNRGLTNIIQNSNYKSKMNMRADLVGLEVGFTF